MNTKKVSIRDFRAGLATFLKALPIELIDGKTGKTLAVVTSPNEVYTSPEKITSATKDYIKYLEEENKNLKELEKMNTRMIEHFNSLPCKWPKGKCFNLGKRGIYFEWVDGEIKQMPMVLCDKHQAESDKIGNARGVYSLEDGVGK